MLHGQNYVRGQELPPQKKQKQKSINSVPAQETAKRRARFRWPPVSDVAAVTKARRENPLKFAGVPQTP